MNPEVLLTLLHDLQTKVMHLFQANRQLQLENEQLKKELNEATAGTLTIVEKDHATGS